MSATSFAEFQARHRRLELLRVLSMVAQYRANTALLVQYMTAAGLGAGHDMVAADLAWLSDAGLVQLQADAVPPVAALTVRGLDVAAGRTQVPGVERPQPGG